MLSTQLKPRWTGKEDKTVEWMENAGPQFSASRGANGGASFDSENSAMVHLESVQGSTNKVEAWYMTTGAADLESVHGGATQVRNQRLDAGLLVRLGL